MLLFQELTASFESCAKDYESLWRILLIIGNVISINLLVRYGGCISEGALDARKIFHIAKGEPK
jgi:hypothetical protein